MSVAGAEEVKKVTLKSCDGQDFIIDESVAMESKTIKHMIEENWAGSFIPLPNVTAKVLAKLIEYCMKHIETPPKFNDRVADEDIKRWEEEYLKVDQETLFDIILAANYLNIKSLLDLTCKTVADMMREKTPEQIREIFHIKCDYTPEELEEVRRESQWAFE